MNKHSKDDLAQMQSLPLDAKIRMTKMRIQQWYDSWKRWEIYNKITGKTRYVTSTEEPPLNEDEYIESATPGWVYVSFSGGKDSSVLKHLVDSMYSDVPSVFVNTGLEYPEIQSFVRRIQTGEYDCFNSDVEIVRPEMRFDEVLKKYGYPIISKEVAKKIQETRSCPNGQASQSFDTNSPKIKKYGARYDLSKWKFLFDSDFLISDKCCTVMKKKPAKQYEKKSGRMPILGTLAEESGLRKTDWLMYGCNAFEKGRPTSQPLSFWTEQDILHYIKKFNVPYCSVYGDIVPTKETAQISIFGEEFDALKTTKCYRTGCIFCMFGVQRDGELNRFQRLKETHPKQYDYCINGGEMVDGKWQPSKEGLGLGRVLDYIGVKY